MTCQSGAELSGNPNPQVLSGALVNGPQRPDDSYTDIRTLANSQVSLGYNAGFTGVVCCAVLVPAACARLQAVKCCSQLKHCTDFFKDKCI